MYTPSLVSLCAVMVVLLKVGVLTLTQDLLVVVQLIVGSASAG